MSHFTKLRWLLSIAGLFMYVADICTDAILVFMYSKEKHFTFAALTLLFVVVGLLVTQIFSSAWYWEDLNCGLIKAEAKTTLLGVSKCGLAALHLLGVGIFVRYGTAMRADASRLLYPKKCKYHQCYRVAECANGSDCIVALGTITATCSQTCITVCTFTGFLGGFSWLTGDSKLPPGESV